jgi:hypothetical protein
MSENKQKCEYFIFANFDLNILLLSNLAHFNQI